MERLFLEDLKDYTLEEVISHLKEEYCGKDYDSSNKTPEVLTESVDNYDVIIAYESVGGWGCDSSGFFLLKDKLDGKFYEVHGSHCSCYGFEGQFEPQESAYEYLISDKFSFWCGGDDDNMTSNKLAVREFLNTKLFEWIQQ